MKRLVNSLRLFKDAFLALRSEIFASLAILIIVTLCFTVVMWIAECRSNPDYTLWDAMVWVIVKYVEDPADVVTAPATVFGQVIGTLVGILGIAIFAVPAGLIGSGLLDAMAEDKSRKEVYKMVSFCISASVESDSRHRGYTTSADIRLRLRVCHVTAPSRIS